MKHGHKKRQQEIRQVSGNQGSSQSISDSDGDQRFGRHGDTRRVEPLGGSRTIRQGIESGCDASGGVSAGGMINQLLFEERERLVGFDKELERLQRGRDAQVSRIEYLEIMFARLKEVSDS